MAKKANKDKKEAKGKTTKKTSEEVKAEETQQTENKTTEESPEEIPGDEKDAAPDGPPAETEPEETPESQEDKQPPDESESAPPPEIDKDNPPDKPEPPAEENLWFTGTLMDIPEEFLPKCATCGDRNVVRGEAKALGKDKIQLAYFCHGDEEVVEIDTGSAGPEEVFLP